MDQNVSRSDFEWVYTVEPHGTRRKQILAKHVKIKELMVHDPWLKWSSALLAAFQLVVVYLIRSLRWAYMIILAVGALFIFIRLINKGFESYSYYGPLNWICFNVGYHTEHHTFPNIPGRLLPKVREFYDNLPYHTSWLQLLWDVLTKPELGPYACLVRHPKSGPTKLNSDLVFGDDATQHGDKFCTE